jgi:hypothetical protein
MGNLPSLLAYCIYFAAANIGFRAPFKAALVKPWHWRNRSVFGWACRPQRSLPGSAGACLGIDVAAFIGDWKVDLLCAQRRIS